MVYGLKRTGPECGIDIKDVVGSDNKLEIFINNPIDNELTTIPKLSPSARSDLNKVGIKTTNQLIAKFMHLDLNYCACVDWIKTVISYNQSKHIVTVIFYRLEMMGFVIPKVPENWRHY